jgi:thioredoxin 1
MSELNSQNFDQAISSSEKCMIDFYATWCGPCKAMNPVLESAETDLGEGKIYKVDVDKNRDLVEKFGIRSVPTFLFFENGEEVNRKSGVIPKGLILEYLN